jgi:hypothetical protein
MADRNTTIDVAIFWHVGKLTFPALANAALAGIDRHMTAPKSRTNRRLPGAAEVIANVYKSESPAWGKRGFLMEKRRVGTARFMSRSTAADKGSTDNGAGSSPRSFSSGR